MKNYHDTTEPEVVEALASRLTFGWAWGHWTRRLLLTSHVSVRCNGKLSPSVIYA